VRASVTSGRISLVFEGWRLQAASRHLLAASAVAVAVVVLTLIPYGLGYVLARPGLEFTGSLMNPEDTNSYLAKMEQGYEGAWLYSIPFTSEPHSPAFIGGFYLFLGHAARVFGLSTIQMWFAARIVFTLLLFLTAFGFIKYCLPDPREAWVAYLIALTGSGLGWLLFALGQTYWLGNFPVDFKMPEAHLFFSALTFPHFAAGVTLIIASVWLSMRAFATQKMVYAVEAGISNLALAIVYPFLIYLIAAFLALNVASLMNSAPRVSLRPGLTAVVMLLIPAPLLLYYLYVLKLNPVFRAWDAQSVTLSPNPLHYLVAYGLLLALAAPTWRDRNLRPLWFWALAVAALVYAPLNPQRRFVEGIQVPLSILAAAGLMACYLPRLRASAFLAKLASRPHYTKEGLERLAVTGLVAFLSVSNLYVLLSTSLTASLEQPYPMFRQQAEIQAVDWAGSHLRNGSVVLAAYETGSLIPARTNLKVVIGHWAETMDFDGKYESVTAFYSQDATNDWRAAFLRRQNVDYVFFGPRERSLGEFDPALDSGLVTIYDSGGVKIFGVSK
jgi:hypothetical protein